ALSATQLDATADVAGSFAYTPAVGTVLNAGTQTLSVTFTPADTTDYADATASVPLTVDKATLTVTANANSKTYRQTASDSGTLTGVVNNDGITASFSSAGDAATAPVGTGSYTITATLADPNHKLANYIVHETDATLTVKKATLTITAIPNSK